MVKTQSGLTVACLLTLGSVITDATSIPFVCNSTISHFDVGEIFAYSGCKGLSGTSKTYDFSSSDHEFRVFHSHTACSPPSTSSGSKSKSSSRPSPSPYRVTEVRDKCTRVFDEALESVSLVIRRMKCFPRECSRMDPCLKHGTNCSSIDPLCSFDPTVNACLSACWAFTDEQCKVAPNCTASSEQCVSDLDLEPPGIPWWVIVIIIVVVILICCCIIVSAIKQCICGAASLGGNAAGGMMGTGTGGMGGMGGMLGAIGIMSLLSRGNGGGQGGGGGLLGGLFGGGGGGANRDMSQPCAPGSPPGSPYNAGAGGPYSPTGGLNNGAPYGPGSNGFNGGSPYPNGGDTYTSNNGGAGNGFGYGQGHPQGFYNGPPQGYGDGHGNGNGSPGGFTEQGFYGGAPPVGFPPLGYPSGGVGGGGPVGPPKASGRLADGHYEDGL